MNINKYVRSHAAAPTKHSGETQPIILSGILDRHALNHKGTSRGPCPGFGLTLLLCCGIEVLIILLFTSCVTHLSFQSVFSVVICSPCVVK